MNPNIKHSHRNKENETTLNSPQTNPSVHRIDDQEHEKRRLTSLHQQVEKKNLSYHFRPLKCPD